jgi:hypothetical protein
MKFNRTFLIFIGCALILLLILAQGNLRATPIAQAQIETLTPESFLPLARKEPTWTPTPTPTPTETPTPTPTPEVQTDFFCQWAPFVEWDFDFIGTVDDTLTIDDTGNITNLILYVNIAHSYVGDLIIDLEHVDTNTAVQVMNRPGSNEIALGCSSNNIGVFLDDSAAEAVEDGCENVGGNNISPALSGNLSPDNPLSAFDGEDLSGDWTIFVEDVVSGDGGTINAWCIFADYGG